MTYRTMLNEAAAGLGAAGVENAAHDAEVLLMEAFGLDRTRLLLDKNRALDTEDSAGETAARCARFRELVAGRAQRVPLQQLLGYAWFCGLSLEVDSRVLTPRQDTEVLVEQVLAERREQDSRVLDLCTGSGCIALALAVLGGYRCVLGTDISADALAVAQANLERLCGQDGASYVDGATLNAAAGQEGSGKTARRQNMTAVTGGLNADVDAALPLAERVRFVRSDLFAALPRRCAASSVLTESVSRSGADMDGLAGWKAFAALPDSFAGFDVIVSNPPYIKSEVIAALEPEVRDHEPRLALDGAADGLFFYRKIAQEAGAYLADGGRLYLEIGYDQGAEVRALLEAQGYRQVRVIKDLAGMDRVVRADKC